jgi:molecular chaperone GrpE
VKRRGNGDDDRSKPEAAAATPAPEAPADEKAEPSGLEAVDAEPLAPLTREEIEALRRERDELAEQLLRKRADFENFRKRVERDRQAAGVDAVAALLKDLAPTLDNLDRALDAPADAEALRQGVEMIRRGLLSVLEARGVVVEDPVGAPFDPSRHQALSHEPAPGHAEGTVVEVYQKGYSFRDRLLRPALVKVAKQATPDADDVRSEPEKVH